MKCDPRKYEISPLPVPRCRCMCYECDPDVERRPTDPTGFDAPICRRHSPNKRRYPAPSTTCSVDRILNASLHSAGNPSWNLPAPDTCMLIACQPQSQRQPRSHSPPCCIRRSILLRFISQEAAFPCIPPVPLPFHQGSFSVWPLGTAQKSKQSRQQQHAKVASSASRNPGPFRWSL